MSTEGVVGAVATVAGLVVLGFVGLVVAARRRRPEATWEPGLEFNPDFRPTVEEIEADLRGEAPSA